MRMVVQAGNQLKLTAAGGQKGFPSANADFFQGFKAVGHERGADDEQFFHSDGSKPREFVVGVGLQPRIAAQAGLEGRRNNCPGVSAARSASACAVRKHCAR